MVKILPTCQNFLHLWKLRKTARESIALLERPISWTITIPKESAKTVEPNHDQPGNWALMSAAVHGGRSWWTRALG